MNLPRLLLALFATCFLSSSCFAQEGDLLALDMEELLNVEIVSSASRYEQSASEAPSAITVVTKEQIQKFGYRNMAELIRSVRGFYTTDDLNYNYTGVRGFGRPADYDSRLLVLLNGHRLNDSIFSSALLGLDFMVDIDRVNRDSVSRSRAEVASSITINLDSL